MIRESNSVVEWDLYTVLVAGSNPVSPTTLTKSNGADNTLIRCD
jgi:hypothetical protein